MLRKKDELFKVQVLFIFYEIYTKVSVGDEYEYNIKSGEIGNV